MSYLYSGNINEYFEFILLKLEREINLIIKRDIGYLEVFYIV